METLFSRTSLVKVAIPFPGRLLPQQPEAQIIHAPLDPVRKTSYRGMKTAAIHGGGCLVLIPGRFFPFI